METLLVTLKDPTKRNLLLALLAEFDFVQVSQSNEVLRTTEVEHDVVYSLFDSIGLMEDRDIDANQLRRSAWER